MTDSGQNRPGIPAGYARSARSSPYLDLIGPLHEAGEGADYRLGMIVDARHMNARGLCHGAVLSAIADVYLGRLVGAAQELRLPLVTVSLGLDFLSAARQGDWLDMRGQVDRVGKTLCHSSGLITAGGRPVLRAHAIFQVFR